MKRSPRYREAVCPRVQVEANGRSEKNIHQIATEEFTTLVRDTGSLFGNILTLLEGKGY